eukprot:CAMPEP_0115545500 /NCGR_PEP_ID=MMETSP0271-20121206/92638_1 /TAXON_ID=71861 /ORGANISM="Scrippsiella trochoidea, Strain CCMP3099" /LENGTH=392 /DNA_ID=CAMNT_0002978853 /DNA_START=17 /DNA_END=1191 /DNA_ORIENTATION=-
MACQQLHGPGRAADILFLHQKVDQIFQQLTELGAHDQSSVPSAERPALNSLSESELEGRGRGSTGAAGREGLGEADHGGNGVGSTGHAAVDIHLQPDEADQIEGAMQSRMRVQSRTGCIIEQVERRAMTLNELRELGGIIKAACSSDKWVDPKTGEGLLPGQVTLYALIHNFVGPLTALEGVKLVGLSGGPYKKGQHVVQAAKRAIGTVRDDSPGPDVEVDLWRGHFCLNAGPVCLDGVDAGTLERVDVPTSRSYKELIAHGPLKPSWYCTHWWGEPVLDFIACVSEHASGRRLSNPSYWVCGYANRQNTVEADIHAGDISQSAFYKAMGLAEGILLIVDKEVKVFSRIWCDLELYVNLTDSKMLLDMVTVPETGTGLGALLFPGTPLPNET